MADQTTVRVEGIGALVRAIKAAEGDLDDLKTANQKAAQIVTDSARGKAPRRSGRLAATGRAGKAAKKATVTFGRASVPYANPIHWGWPARHIKAQPFAWGAAKDTQSEWLPAYDEDLQRIMDTIEKAT